MGDETPDYSNEYTCKNIGKCVECPQNELSLSYCQPNQYKQEVACEWNGGVPKEYQDSHNFPEYVPCEHLEERDRRVFFRNELAFIVVGVLAFAIYVWRKKRLSTSNAYSRV
ncbi:hypothetical protein GQ54DRAFT_57266 [Martensiomyces pterosporus]|nr:hypothetical protein GQ54DRAFT_57266 [Martensiomyces pterosporus]